MGTWLEIKFLEAWFVPFSFELTSYMCLSYGYDFGSPEEYND